MRRRASSGSTGVYTRLAIHLGLVTIHLEVHVPFTRDLQWRRLIAMAEQSVARADDVPL